jgi:aspartate racemase
MLNNSLNKKPIIGIIGGAGPDAAIDIQLKLSMLMKLKLKAFRDQDYYGVITNNDTQIPDRSDAVLVPGNQNLVNLYIQRALTLERMDISILIVACNTAHAFFDAIQSAINVKLLNIIEETARFFSLTYPAVKEVGLLATLGTLRTQIYQETFNKFGIKIVSCDDPIQLRVHQAIYGVKAGYITLFDDEDEDEQLHLNHLYQIYARHSPNKSSIKPVAPQQLALDNIQAKNVQHTILGCTELPLIINQKLYKNHVLIDPNSIIADSAINYCSMLESEYHAIPKCSII